MSRDLDSGVGRPPLTTGVLVTGSLTLVIVTFTSLAGAATSRGRPRREDEADVDILGRGVTFSNDIPERSDCMITAPSRHRVDRADAAGERGAADDRGRDHVGLFGVPRSSDGGVETCRWHCRIDRGQDTHQDEREHDRPADVDAAELSGLGNDRRWRRRSVLNRRRRRRTSSEGRRR